MRSYANRHRILIVFTVMVVVVGSLWWTKTIAFTRSLAIAFSSEPHGSVPRGDLADITPTIVASFPFSEDGQPRRGQNRQHVRRQHIRLRINPDHHRHN